MGIVRGDALEQEYDTSAEPLNLLQEAAEEAEGLESGNSRAPDFVTCWLAMGRPRSQLALDLARALTLRGPAGARARVRHFG